MFVRNMVVEVNSSLIVYIVLFFDQPPNLVKVGNLVESYLYWSTHENVKVGSTLSQIYVSIGNNVTRFMVTGFESMQSLCQHVSTLST